MEKNYTVALEITVVINTVVKAVDDQDAYGLVVERFRELARQESTEEVKFDEVSKPVKIVQIR